MIEGIGFPSERIDEIDRFTNYIRPLLRTIKDSTLLPGQKDVLYNQLVDKFRNAGKLNNFGPDNRTITLANGNKDFFIKLILAGTDVDTDIWSLTLLGYIAVHSSLSSSDMIEILSTLRDMGVNINEIINKISVVHRRTVLDEIDHQINWRTTSLHRIPRLTEMRADLVALGAFTFGEIAEIRMGHGTVAAAAAASRAARATRAANTVAANTEAETMQARTEFVIPKDILAQLIPIKNKTRTSVDAHPTTYVGKSMAPGKELDDMFLVYGIPPYDAQLMAEIRVKGGLDGSKKLSNIEVTDKVAKKYTIVPSRKNRTKHARKITRTATRTGTRKTTRKDNKTIK